MSNFNEYLMTLTLVFLLPAIIGLGVFLMAVIVLDKWSKSKHEELDDL